MGAAVEEAREELMSVASVKVPVAGRREVVAVRVTVVVIVESLRVEEPDVDRFVDEVEDLVLDLVLDCIDSGSSQRRNSHKIRYRALHTRIVPDDVDVRVEARLERRVDDETRVDAVVGIPRSLVDLGILVDPILVVFTTSLLVLVIIIKVVETVGGRVSVRFPEIVSVVVFNTVLVDDSTGTE